jgi:ABC-type uncharacterized transport system
MKSVLARLSAYQWLGIISCAAILIALFSCTNGDDKPKANRPVLGVMTTLPLLWEEGDVGDIIVSSGRRAPAIQRIGQDFEIRPVDVLSRGSLNKIDTLLLVQPRALSPNEFAYLDQWVRSGGKLVLLADPALHWESIYPLGDKRRPLFTSLLSPLFKHWGIELVLPMDEGDTKDQIFDLSGHTIRTVTAGEWQMLGDGAKICAISDVPKVTICNVGAGEAVLLADADLLDDELWRGSGIRALLGYDDFDNVAWVHWQLKRLSKR